MIQKLNELEQFHSRKDPWNYKDNIEDQKRLDILLSEIPEIDYTNVLDIGCGQGFITMNLPGKRIVGLDISQNAITYAKSNNTRKNVSFETCSIFDIEKIISQKFDLIIITGVLYPQYIGNASSLVYLIIDKLLNAKGILITVHINEWYNCQFPLLKIKELLYPYKKYYHKLEIYSK